MDQNNCDLEVPEQRADSPQHLVDTLIVIANALGPLGGALSAALSNYATRKRFTNIQTTLDALRSRLEQLPNEDFKAVLESDEYVHLCLTAMENAQKEHREHKRKLYGISLANAAADTKFTYELTNHFLTLLDRIDDMDLVILQFIAQHGVKDRDEEDWIEFDQIAELSTKADSPPNEMVKVILERLSSFSVLKTKGTSKLMRGTNPTGLWYVSQYSVTETGVKFLEYLKDG